MSLLLKGIITSDATSNKSDKKLTRFHKKLTTSSKNDEEDRTHRIESKNFEGKPYREATETSPEESSVSPCSKSEETNRNESVSLSPVTSENDSASSTSSESGTRIPEVESIQSNLAPDPIMNFTEEHKSDIGNPELAIENPMDCSHNFRESLHPATVQFASKVILRATKTVDGSTDASKHSSSTQSCRHGHDTDAPLDFQIIANGFCPVVREVIEQILEILPVVLLSMDDILDIDELVRGLDDSQSDLQKGLKSASVIKNSVEESIKEIMGDLRKQQETGDKRRAVRPRAILVACDEYDSNSARKLVFRQVRKAAATSGRAARTGQQAQPLRIDTHSNLKRRKDCTGEDSCYNLAAELKQYSKILADTDATAARIRADLVDVRKLREGAVRSLCNYISGIGHETSRS